jgi:hypothetical protein
MRFNFSGRQWILNLLSVFGYVDYNNAEDGDVSYLTIPPGAQVTTAIAINVTTAFVGPTTAELIVTDDSDGSPVATIDLTAGGATSILAVGAYPEGFRAKIELNKDATAATAGAFQSEGAYLVENRTNEIQPEHKAFA